MTTLVIKERQIEKVTILDMEGNLRIGDGSVSFRTAIRQMILEEKRCVLLNLEGVKYIDSSGLGELISGYTSIRKNDGHLKLLHLSEKVHELMMVTKLLTVFDVYDDELKAIQSFSNSSCSSNLEIKETPVTVKEVYHKSDDNKLWPRDANQSKLL